MAKRTTTRRKRAEQNGHIDDGTITIRVQGGELDGQTLSLDAAVVFLAAEPIETRLGLRPDDEQLLHPTPEFAVELTKALRELGYQVTPTIALHAWSAARQRLSGLQKKTSGSTS